VSADRIVCPDPEGHCGHILAGLERDGLLKVVTPTPENRRVRCPDCGHLGLDCEERGEHNDARFECPACGWYEWWTSNGGPFGPPYGSPTFDAWQAQEDALDFEED
jgi:predicted RNA-binding Zn-ribbon protein involved in translation (DUF1610 family)